jgi:hypothetical protein
LQSTNGASYDPFRSDGQGEAKDGAWFLTEVFFPFAKTFEELCDGERYVCSPESNGVKIEMLRKLLWR